MIEGIRGGSTPQVSGRCGPRRPTERHRHRRVGHPVGLGFYLPFSIVLTDTMGAVARELTDWLQGKRFSEVVGIPVAAGLIVGEGVVGVGFSLYMIVSGMKDVT